MRLISRPGRPVPLNRSKRPHHVGWSRGISATSGGERPVPVERGRVVAPDVGSQTYMAERRAPGNLTADIVFADPSLRIEASSHSTRRIAVGVMSYRGWTDKAIEGAAATDRYVANLAELSGRLLDEGFEVSLVVGAQSDHATVEKVLEGIAASGRDDGERLTTLQIDSLRDLCVEFAATMAPSSRATTTSCAR